MLKVISILTLLLTLAGCAQSPPNPYLAASASRNVTCVQGPDCESKWSRALQWVLANSSWKIQIQTDQMIQTFGPGNRSPSSAFVITKTTNGNGAYNINFTSACDNIFGCFPSSLELKASFNNAVGQ